MIFQENCEKFTRKQTCCMILGNSEQRALRPDSSKVLSSVRSWSARRVVSSMSKPVWLANVKIGEACKTKELLSHFNKFKNMSPRSKPFTYICFHGAAQDCIGMAPELVQQCVTTGLRIRAKEICTSVNSTAAITKRSFRLNKHSD